MLQRKAPALRAGAFNRARWVLRHSKEPVSLAVIAASLNLVAIMHHEINAIPVPWENGRDKSNSSRAFPVNPIYLS